MTAVIYQLRDYQNPKDLARLYGQTFEQHALAMASAAFDIGLAGMDFGMTIYESSLGYVAPEKDGA